MARALVKDATTLLSADIGIVTIPGEVKTYAGTTAPTGFLLCHGQAVSRTTYFNLYAAIGTEYGQGDNSTTFNVPDYQGMFLRGRVNTPASVSGSGTPTTNNATFASHGINRNGFRVRFTSVGTLTGVVINTDYYAIVVDSTTLAFAATLANATAGTPTKIVLGGTNNAVIAQWEDPDASSRLQAATGANGGMSVGSLQADAMQGHMHGWRGNKTINFAGGGSQWGVANATSINYPNNDGTLIMSPSTDSVNGTPRTSTETRPKNMSINYIIKT